MIDTKTNSLTPMRIYLVPGWIYRSILRNKLNTIDMNNYAKIRGVLSVDDMAEWFYANDQLKVQGCRLSDSYLDSNWEDFSPAHRAEVNNSVLPLSGSEPIADNVKTKLATSNTVSDGQYQFVTVSNILYVILNEGFMNTLKDPTAQKEFVRSYLKQCYAMAAVHTVSQCSIFDLYMKQFAI